MNLVDSKNSVRFLVLSCILVNVVVWFFLNSGSTEPSKYLLDGKEEMEQLSELQIKLR